MDVPKVHTYIEGFDEILGGGVPQGAVVLVSGLPGTMKSTLTYSLLYQNARSRGAKALYVSLEQTRVSLDQQMAAMGFDIESVRDHLRILDVTAIRKEIGRGATKPWMDFLRRTLETRKSIDGVDLVVLDSLEALDVLAKFGDRRAELFHFFEWLRDLGATSFVLTEAAPEPIPLGLGADSGQAHRDASFLADGVIQLSLHPVNDVDVQRRLRIVKMRSANHKTGAYAMVFDGGRFQITSAMSA